MEFKFSVKIYAPEGMDKIKPFLDDCRLKLNIDKASGYGKALLINAHPNSVTFTMAPSKNNYLIANGTIEGDIDITRLLIGDFEIALVHGGYPHESNFKDTSGQYNEGSSFMWVGQHDS